MKPRDIFDLIALGAIWGGAFPLLRVASPVFGPFALIAVRVAVAGLALSFMVNNRRALREHSGKLFALAMLNTALPFTLFSYATLKIPGGLAALLNATTPMFGAAIAWGWLGERLSAPRLLGIVIGFVGIASIVWDKLAVHVDGALLGVLAGLAGAALYGAAACYAKRYLSQLESRVTAAGSVLGAALVMIPLGAMRWPDTAISPGVWICAVALGLICTALAYVIYFRLMAAVGAARAVTVTFLIPVFGIVWGAVFLHEVITARLLLSCGVVLFGTALATGLIGRPASAAAAPR